MLRAEIKEKDIVEKIGDENIYKRYFGDFDFTTTYNSPFREDSRPSAGFFMNGEGRIVFNDYGVDGKLNSIEFVQKVFGINYYQAISKIAADFGLSGEKIDEFEPLKTVVKPKKQAVIELIVGKFAEEHLKYWEQYHISPKELEENFVYYAKGLKINSKDYPLPDDNLRFAYIINHGEKRYAKIYSPCSKEGKWFGNVTGNPLFGFNELPYLSDTLIVSKSAKDRLVLKKFFSDVVAVQSESSSSITKKDVEYLKSRYSRIIVWFDNDEAGLISLKKLEKKDLETFHFPEKAYTEFGIKDPSDFIKKYGKKILLRWIKNQKKFDGIVRV